MAAATSAAPAVGRVLVMGATDFGAIGRDPGAGKNVCHCLSAEPPAAF
jgi:hypothetical protein